MAEAVQTPSQAPAAPSPWLVAATLAWREIVRFFRQRSRVVGAVGQPVLFWLLFGAGLHRWFRLGGEGLADQSFLAYYFPGTLVLILLFTAIFATISIIEDRREGFLQSVLVAPIPRWSMVLGKVLGGSLIAMLQGLLFLLLAWTLPIELVPKVGEYLSLVMRLIFAFGISFELPVLITLMAKAGLATSDGLKGKRRYAIVLAFVAAAVLTPPDPLSQIGLAVPIIVLYEISIICARMVEKKREKEDAAQEV